jgi:hypothetical protein
VPGARTKQDDATAAQLSPDPALSHTVRLQPSHMENRLSEAFDHLWNEILAFSSAHPGMAVEVTWQVAPAGDSTTAPGAPTSADDGAQT